MKAQTDLYLTASGAKVKKAVGSRAAVSVIIDVSWFSQCVDSNDIISQTFHACNESLNTGDSIIPGGAVCVNKCV